MKLPLLALFSFFLIQTNAQTVGLFYNNPGSLPGYVLFAPGRSDTTYLIDKCGKRVHTWHSNYFPGLSVHLSTDGTLLRCGTTNNLNFIAGGTGGILEEYDWNSNLTWSYQISDENVCQHHDAIQLPGGNILTIVWQKYSKGEAVERGRNPDLVGSEIWCDKIVEIKLIGADSGEVVWEWNAWDHLVQDYDSSKLNFNVISAHPELLNINADATQEADWLHCNSLDYDSHLDQILISCHNLSEVWIIDHSTTTAQAASHGGGLAGKGGDILYRWGNPQNYNRGTADDQMFFEQHDATWIPSGLPGQGRIMVFNNGVDRPDGMYSTVETFSPPAPVNYSYPINGPGPYLPFAQNWVYIAFPPLSFFSSVEGGAQRLPNGNTIICEATGGEFFEVDSLGNSLWKYVNPVGINGITSQGNQPLGNVAFRCTWLPADYAGFLGQILTPGSPIELNPLNYSCNNIVTAVADLQADEALHVFPDPFQQDFFVSAPMQINDAIIRIHDAMGRLVYEELNASLSSTDAHQIHLSNVTGLLMLTIIDEDEKQEWNQKLIAQ